MMGICGAFSDDEDSFTLTEKGVELIKKADDDDGEFVYMTDGFDGDSLGQVSESWPLHVKFEY